jgi:hypothetical protein
MVSFSRIRIKGTVQWQFFQEAFTVSCEDVGFVCCFIFLDVSHLALGNTVTCVFGQYCVRIRVFSQKTAFDTCSSLHLLYDGYFIVGSAALPPHPHAFHTTWQAGGQCMFLCCTVVLFSACAAWPSCATHEVTCCTAGNQAVEQVRSFCISGSFS